MRGNVFQPGLQLSRPVSPELAALRSAGGGMVGMRCLERTKQEVTDDIMPAEQPMEERRGEKCRAKRSLRPIPGSSARC